MLHRRVWLRSAAWSLAAWILLWSGIGAATAQIRILPEAASTADIEAVLHRGRELEIQRRWGDAVTLYEDAARLHPGQPAIEQRLNLTRLHYDIGRRYADPAFRRTTATIGEQEALTLYSEVLSKVYSYYVNTPDWQAMVERGRVAMEVALHEPAFVEVHRLHPSEDRLQGFRRELNLLLDARPARDRTAARDSAYHAARLAHRHLGIRPASVILEFTCAATGGLDEYSAFLTREQLDDLYAQIEGNFVGLGVELKAADGALLIVNVIRGSPAERAGIRPGDRITAVGNKSTHDVTTDQAAALLQGPEGSTVELFVVTGREAPRRVVVRREHVEVPSVDDVRMVDVDGGIAYLKLTCFQKTTARDLDAALWKLHREGMRSLILDLRGNPGGLLTAAVEVADRFIESGSIVATRGRSPMEDFNYTANRAGTWRVPLVVLIDGDSASASEIFAGAIRDHRRGTIVGVRSYGKGSVQGIFPLTVAGAGVRLTTAKFYSPNGHPFNRVGVEPNIQVHVAARPIDGNETAPAHDAILAAGIQAARSQVAQR